MNNLKELSFQEKNEINGGILGPLAIAFWSGVAYGYVKEKFDSGQW